MLSDDFGKAFAPSCFTAIGMVAATSSVSKPMPDQNTIFGKITVYILYFSSSSNFPKQTRLIMQAGSQESTANLIERQAKTN